jgi:hypothetical protein
MFLRNAGIYLQVHTALQSRRPTPTSPKGFVMWGLDTGTTTYKSDRLCDAFLTEVVFLFFKIYLNKPEFLSYHGIIRQVKLSLKFQEVSCTLIRR